MRLRYMMAVPLVAAIALPLAGRSARGDVRLNAAVQTALDLGQVIGAATACPDIAPARIKGLTNRFTAALKEFAANKDETATVGGAFEQGVIFGGQSIGVRQTRCDAASRDLAGWEANTVPLMPAAPVLAAPVLAAPVLAANPL